MCRKTWNNFAITTNGYKERRKVFELSRLFYRSCNVIPPRHWNGHPLCRAFTSPWRWIRDHTQGPPSCGGLSEGGTGSFVVQEVVRRETRSSLNVPSIPGIPLVIRIHAYIRTYISLAVLNRPRSFSRLETRRFRYGNIRIVGKNSLHVGN